VRVLTVVGARPEFIKSLALSRAFAVTGMEELVVHTGQHYDDQMSAVFFQELDLPTPWRRLNTGGGSHATQTAEMLLGLERACLDAAPDWVIVYGDTNSTLAGGLVAAKLNVPLGHVEAGLRSYNRLMPEEVNRVVVDHLSDALFAPTQIAVNNLVREGVPSANVHLVGDVNYDVTLMVRGHPPTRPCVAGVTHDSGGYVVATVHRAENTDDPVRLRHILKGLERVSAHVPVIFPVHPRTRSAIGDAGIEVTAPGIQLVDPMGFVDMVDLLSGAAVIATDSGGIQKEAFFLEVPCATLRTETEWLETVELGWNRLVDLGSADSVASGILDAVGRRGRDAKPYGNGHAAGAIVDVLQIL
jgi:UDP-GlcNAc3NAcA epimerase